MNDFWEYLMWEHFDNVDLEDLEIMLNWCRKHDWGKNASLVDAYGNGQHRIILPATQHQRTQVFFMASDLLEFAGY